MGSMHIASFVGISFDVGHPHFKKFHLHSIMILKIIFASLLDISHRSFIIMVDKNFELDFYSY
jgi:hypothetical protein